MLETKRNILLHVGFKIKHTCCFLSTGSVDLHHEQLRLGVAGGNELRGSENGYSVVIVGNIEFVA